MASLPEWRHGPTIGCTGETCLCNATGCAAFMAAITDPNDPAYGQFLIRTPPTLSFDMFISGGVASGSVGGDFNGNNVHFVKDP